VLNRLPYYLKPLQRRKKTVKFLDGVLLVLCTLTVIICAVISNKWLMDGPSVIIVLLFNVLFTLILSQLHGSISTKASILTVGNLLGTALNLLFYAFAEDLHTLTGLSTSVVLTVTYPILNFVWIVPFWSLSLSLFSNPAVPEKVQK
jgi:uncharacterized membrane protein